MDGSGRGGAGAGGRMRWIRGKLTALGTILAGSTAGTENRLAPKRMDGAMKE